LKSKSLTILEPKPVSLKGGVFVLLGIFGILGILLSSVPIYADELPPEVLYGRAVDFYKEGNFREAEKLFKKVVKADTKHKKAKKYLKKIEDREIKLKKIKVKKGNYYNAATGYYQKKMYKEAIIELKKLLKIDSKHSESLRLIKKAKKKLREKKTAGGKKKDLEKRDTADDSKGQVSIRDNKKQKKEKAALEKKYKRARLYFRKKKYSKAVEILKEIIAAESPLWRESSSYSKARKLLSRAEKKEAEGIAKAAGDRKGRPYAEAKRPAAKKAKTPVVKTAGLTKKEIRELYKKGERVFKAGKYKEAIDYFMQALIAEPGSRKARKYIKMSADEILRPRIEKINKQRQAMVFDARTLIFARQKKYDVRALYAAAVKNYKKKNYIRSSDKLRQIMKVSEGYKDTEKYFSLIEGKMYKNSVMGVSTDAETLSYAQGYLDWWAKKIQPAVNEWEKCLALNPRNKEVKEYHGKAKKILEMASRKEYQAEIEAKLKAVFAQGEKLCGRKKYVDAIKKYEKVIDISEETPISTSLKWSADARLRIEYALGRLKKMTAKAPKRKKVAEKKEEVIDVKSAQRHYTTGLVAYAQGRLREAIREWDLALRLNPGHEKARLARRKAKKELGYK